MHLKFKPSVHQSVLTFFPSKCVIDALDVIYALKLVFFFSVFNIVLLLKVPVEIVEVFRQSMRL